MRADKKIERKIRSLWKLKGRGKIPESVFNQAEVFEGKNVEILQNDCGTAPGFIINSDEKKICFIVLPGPPAEAMPMLRKNLDKILKNLPIQKVFCRQVLCSGLPESTVEEITVRVLKDNKDVVPAYCASVESVKIFLKSSCPVKLDSVFKELENKLGRYVLSHNTACLEEEIIKILKEKGESLSVAESCTGGMLGEKITNVPGASDVFKGGIIAYSNEIKTRFLGIETTVIKRSGAVSKECAEAMLIGVKKQFKTDAAISITGIAGPGGGSRSKPVGLVFIGTSYIKKTEIIKFLFNGDRNLIRHRAVSAALNLLKKIILEN
jgi:nicotinamide-nucleotide amidase